MARVSIAPDKFKGKQVHLMQDLTQKRDTVFARFPLLFVLLGTFGLVATLYGFERIIDRITFLANNPFILVGIGLAVLILTGTLYKKLE